MGQSKSKQAEELCKEFLLSNQIIDICEDKKEEGCDIVGYKDGKKLYFEIKSSSGRSKKSFYGSVMQSELLLAIKNRENYKFIICRVVNKKLDPALTILTVDEFLAYCKYQSPLYRYSYNKNKVSSQKHRNIKNLEGIIIKMQKLHDMCKEIDKN